MHLDNLEVDVLEGKSWMAGMSWRAVGIVKEPIAMHSWNGSRYSTTNPNRSIGD